MGARKATLELHRAFKRPQGHIFGGEAREYEAVLGQTTRSEPITVLGAVQAGVPMHFGAGGFRATERIVSSRVVVGAHVESGTTYTELRAWIPGLEIWFDPAGGITQTVLDKTAESPVTIIYEVQGVRETLTEIPSISATLGWGTERNFAGSRETEFSVKTSGWLAIRPTEPKSLAWLIDHLGRATTLLGMVAGTSMSPSQITAKLSDGTPVDVLVAMRDAKYCGHRSSHDFFMLRQGMGVDAGIAFAKWFELYDRLAMPAQLALSVLYSEGLWLHVEFLSLMQALEGFHRAVMSGA